MRNVRLCPRRGFSWHGAMLQLRDAGGRPRHRGMGRNAMIYRSKIGLILFRNLLVLLLRRSRRKMRLAGKGLLLRCGFGGNSIRATVEARVGIIDDRRVVDDRRIDVGRMNYGGVYAHCRCVVSEDSTAPLVAGKAASAITESIVHATVEANLCSPIPGMEDIHTSIPPPPIARSPEVAWLRSEDPCTWDPIVAANAIPRPIARCPHVVGLRAGRLNVNRENGRFDMMLMPIEICARDPAGVKTSAPVRRAPRRNRVTEEFIRNRLFSTFVRRPIIGHSRRPL